MINSVIITGIEAENAKHRLNVLMVVAACSTASYEDLVNCKCEWPKHIFPCYAEESDRLDGNGEPLLVTAYGTISRTYVNTNA